MGFTEVLYGLKGKVLDAANFDGLMRAYETQQHNIDQLRHKDELLTARVKELETANRELSKANKVLTSKLAPFEAKPSADKLDHIAELILTVLGQIAADPKGFRDVTINSDKITQMVQRLENGENLPQPKVEYHLEELTNAKYISKFNGYSSDIYHLEQRGRKYLIDQKLL